MSRKLRIEYPGAMYHVMNRGDQREVAQEVLGQGCIKLQFEDSPERGGDGLSLQFQVHSAGDRLSPPRKTELDAALVLGLCQK